MAKKSITGCCKIVGYLRTSTDDQLLGIEAQRETLARIAAERGCEIVRTFIEHESGGDNDRPELDKALKHARRVGASVLVAKLDRLSRNSAFLMKLHDGDVAIIFGDLPEVDGSANSRFIVHVMAGIAELERKRTGERTKAALAVLKARGVTLGTPANLTHEGRILGSRRAAVKRVEQAIEEMTDVAPIIARLKAEGLKLQQIADQLNSEGYVTRQGKSWQPVQVKRILDRSNNA